MPRKAKKSKGKSVNKRVTENRKQGTKRGKKGVAPESYNPFGQKASRKKKRKKRSR